LCGLPQPKKLLSVICTEHDRRESTIFFIWIEGYQITPRFHRYSRVRPVSGSVRA